MEKSLNTLRVSHGQESGFRCSGCNEVFQKPLLTTNSSNERIQVYYACPRCLSRVDDVEKRRDEGEKRGGSTFVEKTRKIVGEHEETDCKHFLGYLKKRPKNSAIPDECLVCERMIECLTC